MEQILIATLTPIVIAMFKRLAAYMEKAIPSSILPLIAPLLGVLATYVLPLVGLPAVDPATGATLGLAGVGVREAAVKSARVVTK